MLNFHIITLNDKPLADAFFKKSEFLGNELTFASLFNWRDTYSTEICESNGTLYFRGADGIGKFYHAPLGCNSKEEMKKAVLELKELENGKTVRLFNFSKTEKTLLEEAFGNEIKITENRDNSDYIYEREKLANLAGKKLHAKRNHINKFKAKYPNYEIVPLTASDHDECMELNSRWKEENAGYITDETPIISENKAISDAIKNFDALECKGLILRVDGKTVGFTLGSERNKDVFVTHFEKALFSYEGSYAMLNREMALYLEKYKYINREDDVGDEGLRKAKMSYQPCFLAEKFNGEL